jgi:hypothetical protein
MRIKNYLSSSVAFQSVGVCKKLLFKGTVSKYGYLRCRCVDFIQSFLEKNIEFVRKKGK